MQVELLGVRVNQTSYFDATHAVLDAANDRRSRYVCIANVHMLMEANDSGAFKAIVNDADLVTPDGMPLVWMMRIKGVRNQQRVYGPTLMLHVLEAAVKAGVPVGFYGGTPDVLEQLIKRLQILHEGLNVAFSCSPPFRDLTPEEDAEIVQKVNQSAARILFVGLGCPRQERWMAGHRGRVQAVMLGVGAAFDFYAGTKPQAPSWIQTAGLEWLFRLLTEPRRLWKRYFYHNPRFVFLAIAELLGGSRSR